MLAESTIGTKPLPRPMQSQMQLNGRSQRNIKENLFSRWLISSRQAVYLMSGRVCSEVEARRGTARFSTVEQTTIVASFR